MANALRMVSASARMATKVKTAAKESARRMQVLSAVEKTKEHAMRLKVHVSVNTCTLVKRAAKSFALTVVMDMANVLKKSQHYWRPLQRKVQHKSL